MKIINAVVREAKSKGRPFDPFFASVADIGADNPNGNKTFLTRGESTLFINGKPAVINVLRNFKIFLLD